jgi:hypothetical protein
VDRQQTGTEPGFDTQLDLSDPDHFSEAEAAALLEWYESSHADGEPGLTDFVGFLIAVRPRALKLYRAYAQALHAHGGVPQLAVALWFLRYYMTLGNDKGVLYEVVAARQWGATKAEVIDTIESGFLISGPFGANAAAHSLAYLQDWPDDEPRKLADPWPASWLDREIPDGTESASDRFLGRLAPDVLAAWTARHAPLTGRRPALPAPMFPMMDLHHAVADGRPAEAADAAMAGLAVGLSVPELTEVVGFGGLYAAPARLAAVVEALEPVFASESRR